MAIENFNDLVYKDDVCMTHVRSKPAAQHQCVPGRHNFSIKHNVFNKEEEYTQICM